MLKRIFGPKKYEVTGEWRRLHNVELYALYSSPNIIRVIKSIRQRWNGYVACIGRGEVHTGFLWENQTEGGHLEDPGVNDNIKTDLREVGWGHALHRSGSG